MSNWKIAFPGIIPPRTSSYSIRVFDGDEGLSIELVNETTKILLDFGITVATRIFEETTVESPIHGDGIDQALIAEATRHIVYELENANFKKETQKIMGELWDIIEDPRHYVIHSSNYIVEVISRGVPDVRVCPTTPPESKN